MSMAKPAVKAPSSQRLEACGNPTVRPHSLSSDGSMQTMPLSNVYTYIHIFITYTYTPIAHVCRERERERGRANELCDAGSSKP